MRATIPGILLLILSMILMTGTALSNPIDTTESAGTCEMYKDLAGVDDDALDCNPGPNFDVCGAYPWEEKVYKQGPEVDPVVEDHEAHYEACMDIRTEQNHCVLGTSETGTELVEEGTVTNIAPEHHDTDFHDEDYQTGGHSPDRMACLNIEGGAAGEWYSLDDASINDYLVEREEAGDLDLDPREQGEPHQDPPYVLV